MAMVRRHSSSTRSRRLMGSRRPAEEIVKGLQRRIRRRRGLVVTGSMSRGQWGAVEEGIDRIDVVLLRGRRWIGGRSSGAGRGGGRGLRRCDNVS